MISLKSFKINRLKFIIFGCLFFLLEAVINISDYFIQYEDIDCERGYYDSGRNFGESFRSPGKATGTRFYLIDSERYIVGRYVHNSDNLTVHKFINGNISDDRSVRFICFAKQRSYIPFLYQDVIISYKDEKIDREMFMTSYSSSLINLNRSGFTAIFNNFILVFLISLEFSKE
jgi:hypothetical protein